MLSKILIMIGIVLAALVALRVFGRAAEAKMTRTEEQARDTVRRKIKGEDFVKCGGCGAYTAQAEICGCGQ